MAWLYRSFQWLARQRFAFAGLLLLALLLHIGTTIRGGLYADDYIHRAYFLGSAVLQQKGFLDGIAVGDFSGLLRDQFNFFDPREPNYKTMAAFGMLPWWASGDALLHFFRPLATVTHYLDYQWWPHNTHIMHGVSLLWYVLGIAVIYRLYRGVGVPKPVALLALLLVILDQSVYQVITWIASRSMLMVIVLGFFAVYAYHKSMHSRLWYVVGLLALLLAALSAEAVIGICAYLGAYLFTLDKRPWAKRIVHIVPFAAIILLWHYYYQQQGYGAFGVDFYLDPGHQPQQFLQTALYRLPANFFEMIAGVDIQAGQLRTDLHHALWLYGVAVFAVLLWLLWPMLQAQPVMAFFALGSLFSLVPGLTIALSPRVLVLPFVGAAVVLSYLFDFVAQQWHSRLRHYLATTVCVYLFLAHILAASGFAVLALYYTVASPLPEKPYGYVDLGVKDIAGKPVVVINAYRPFWLAFYPYYLQDQNELLPSSLRVLGSAFNPLRVTRIAERELQLQAFPAFQLDAAPLMNTGSQPDMHPAYVMQELMGLIRSASDEWHVGDTFSYKEMNITVTSLYHGKPQKLTVELKANLADYRWSYWQQSKQAYAEFILPDIGKSVDIEGIFSN